MHICNNDYNSAIQAAIQVVDKKNNDLSTNIVNPAESLYPLSEFYYIYLLNTPQQS